MLETHFGIKLFIYISTSNIICLFFFHAKWAMVKILKDQRVEARTIEVLQESLSGEDYRLP